MEIQQAQVRAKLPVRREPHWRQLERGFFIGFRKSRDGGTWLARLRDPDSGKQLYRPLGSVTDLTYADAAAEAVKWRQQCAQGVVKAERVHAALAAYVQDLRQRKGGRSAADAETTFKALIYGDDAPAIGRSFGGVRLDKLRVADVRRFRDSLVAGRTKATANRIMRRVKAALSWSYRNQLTPSDTAWRHVPAFPAADGRRDVYLTLEQRRAILAECPAALTVFLTALLHTAARPGELAAATVGDFNRKQKTLCLVSNKGRDGVPRARHVDLTDEAADLLAKHARLRMKTLPLLVNDQGNAWQKKHWAELLRRAVAAARKRGTLPDDIVPYSFRHSVITDWLRGGMNVGDVAKQAGTSIVMISRTYYQPGDTRTIRAGIAVL